MNLKMIALIIFALLIFKIKANADQNTVTQASKKIANTSQNHTLIPNKKIAYLEAFPNRSKKAKAKSKLLHLRTDFWFAFIAIGSLASMILIKGNISRNN